MCHFRSNLLQNSEKNIKNKVYKFRRQSQTVYIPNDDRPWGYFENQSVFPNTRFEIPGRSKTRYQRPGPDREGSFRSRESFWSLRPLPCSCVMLKSNDTIKMVETMAIKNKQVGDTNYMRLVDHFGT